MTVIAASGCISQIDDALQNLLASCAAWQDWTGTADADAARGHISQKGIAADGDEPTFSAAELVNLRPAAIFFADEESAYIFNWSAEAGFIGGGSASFILQDNIPAHLADDIPGADRWFKNKLGDVVDDMRETAGSGGHLLVQQIIVSETTRSPRDDRPSLGDYATAMIRVIFGNLES